MDFSNHIFRSHSVGNLINPPKPLTANQKETLNVYNERQNGIGKPLTKKQLEQWYSLHNKLQESKKYKLTDTAKYKLAEMHMAFKYGRKTQLNAPQIRKGLEKEKESRDLISDVNNIFLISDNERKENKWVTGQRDIKHKDICIDIKTAYSFESFNKRILDKPNEIYLRQLDCYMELWGCNESVLIHTLVDTPIDIVYSQIRKKDYHEDILTIEGEVKDLEKVKSIIYNHIYTEKGLYDFCEFYPSFDKGLFQDFKEIPKKDRVHMIPHKFNKERIQQRNESILLAREFLNNIKYSNSITIIK